MTTEEIHALIDATFVRRDLRSIDDSALLGTVVYNTCASLGIKSIERNNLGALKTETDSGNYLLVEQEHAYLVVRGKFKPSLDWDVVETFLHGMIKKESVVALRKETRAKKTKKSRDNTRGGWKKDTHQDSVMAMLRKGIVPINLDQDVDEVELEQIYRFCWLTHTGQKPKLGFLPR